MQFYLVQHGLALDKAENPERPLSPAGERQTRTIAAQLAAVGVDLQRIYHSGKTRARQTAELFAAALDHPPVAEHEYLNPADDPTLLLPHLSSRCLYVGHLPHMEKLVSLLLGGNVDTRPVRFANSAVMCVGRDDAEFYLDWVLKPALLATG